MLHDLAFSLATVTPLFAMMVLGFGLRHNGLITDTFAANGNRLMFYIGLPAIIFRAIVRADMGEIFDVRFVLAMLFLTVGTAGAIWLAGVPLVKDKKARGAFILSAFRGNQAFLGIPIGPLRIARF